MEYQFNTTFPTTAKAALYIQGIRSHAILGRVLLILGLRLMIDAIDPLRIAYFASQITSIKTQTERYNKLTTWLSDQ